MDSGLFATGALDATVQLWDANTASVVSTFALPGNVHCVSFNSCGSLLAAATTDSAVQLIDPAGGTALHVLQGHQGAVRAVTWLPHTDYFVITGGADGAVRVWDIRRAGTCMVLDRMRSAATVQLADRSRIQFSDAQPFALPRSGVPGGGGGGARGRREEKGSARAHEAGVSGVQASPDGQWIVSVGQDSRIQVWDAHTGIRVVTAFGGFTAMRVEGGQRFGLASRPDVLAVPSGRKVRVYSLREGGDAWLSLGSHEALVTACVINPRDQSILAGFADGSILRWAPRLPCPGPDFDPDEVEAFRASQRERGGGEEPGARRRREDAAGRASADVAARQATERAISTAAAALHAAVRRTAPVCERARSLGTTSENLVQLMEDAMRRHVTAAVTAAAARPPRDLHSNEPATASGAVARAAAVEDAEDNGDVYYDGLPGYSFLDEEWEEAPEPASRAPAVGLDIDALRQLEGEARASLREAEGLSKRAPGLARDLDVLGPALAAHAEQTTVLERERMRMLTDIRAAYLSLLETRRRLNLVLTKLQPMIVGVGVGDEAPTAAAAAAGIASAAAAAGRDTDRRMCDNAPAHAGAGPVPTTSTVRVTWTSDGDAALPLSMAADLQNHWGPSEPVQRDMKLVRELTGFGLVASLAPPREEFRRKWEEEEQHPMLVRRQQLAAAAAQSGGPQAGVPQDIVIRLAEGEGEGAVGGTEGVGGKKSKKRPAPKTVQGVLKNLIQKSHKKR